MGRGFSLQLLHPPLELRPEEQQLLQALVHWHLQQQSAMRSGVRICRERNNGPPPAALEPSHLWSHARVPAGVVAAPQLEVSGRYCRVQDVVLIVHIKGVGEVFGLAARRTPRSCQVLLTLITHRVCRGSETTAEPFKSTPCVHRLRLHLGCLPSDDIPTNRSQQSSTMHCMRDRKSGEKRK